MLKTYTAAEMLQLQKIRLGIYTGVDPSESEDNTALDKWILAGLQARYRYLLMVENPFTLPQRDIKTDCEIERDTYDTVRIYMPNDVVRPTILRINGVRHTITEFLPNDTPFYTTALYQQFENSKHPVAVNFGQYIDIYHLPKQGISIDMFMAVYAPAEDSYVVDSSWLVHLLDPKLKI
jgi:hypothetical protein